MTSTPVVRAALFGLLALLITSCGAKEGAEDPDAKRRPPPPLTKLKLKNLSPEQPASARVDGTQAGRSKPPLTVGPVAPGQESINTPPGAEAVDALSVTVTMHPSGPVLHGQGSWPGAFVGEVHVETAGAMPTVTVHFATGQPPATLPLGP